MSQLKVFQIYHRMFFLGKLDVEYRTHLGRYGVTGELALRPITSLSGGQKSRVAFAVMTWHQ